MQSQHDRLTNTRSQFTKVTGVASDYAMGATNLSDNSGGSGEGVSDHGGSVHIMVGRGDKSDRGYKPSTAKSVDKNEPTRQPSADISVHSAVIRGVGVISPMSISVGKMDASLGKANTTNALLERMRNSAAQGPQGQGPQGSGSVLRPLYTKPQTSSSSLHMS